MERGRLGRCDHLPWGGPPTRDTPATGTRPKRGPDPPRPGPGPARPRPEPPPTRPGLGTWRPSGSLAPFLKDRGGAGGVAAAAPRHRAPGSQLSALRPWPLEGHPESQTCQRSRERALTLPQLGLVTREPTLSHSPQLASSRERLDSKRQEAWQKAETSGLWPSPYSVWLPGRKCVCLVPFFLRAEGSFVPGKEWFCFPKLCAGGCSQLF